MNQRAMQTEAKQATAGTIRLTTAQALVRYLAALSHPVGRTAVRRRLRDLRTRQRRGDRRGALPASRGIADLARAQRAGDGAQRDRVCEGEFSPPHDGRHHLDRTGRDEPRHCRRACACEPLARAAAARRCVRLARARSGAAASRGFQRRRHLRQRCVQARIALLRSHRASGAIAERVAACDARADRRRAVRSGHARVAAGRAGDGLRLSRGFLRAARRVVSCARAGRTKRSSRRPPHCARAKSR